MHSSAKPSLNRFLPLVLCLPLSSCTGDVDSSSESPSRVFEFALLGDNPYSQGKAVEFEALIGDVNRQAVAWVLHVGDIKAGSEPCSDELFERRFELFRRFEAPFVYTPGDNEWFDCGRSGFEPLERLTRVRDIYFRDRQASAVFDGLAASAQSDDPSFSEFSENLLWEKNGVVFATVHLVAARGDRSTAVVETTVRQMDAALAWIERAFERAIDMDSPAVFLATHVDPWLAGGLTNSIRRSCPQCSEPRAGMDRLYPALAAASDAFDGPVVMAVGDSHVFRVDKPLRRPTSGELVENFTRVEVFGNPQVHWLRVRVDPDRRAVFSYQEEVGALADGVQ